MRDRTRRLETLPKAGMAITGFFAEVLSRTLNDPFHRGCLLVNSALEANAEDTDLQQAVAEEFEAIRTFLKAACKPFGCNLSILWRFM